MTDSQRSGPELIDLREAIAVLRMRRWTIVLVVLVVVTLALFLVYRRAPVYAASARVEVRPLTSALAYPGVTWDLQASMETESERVTSDPVTTRAHDVLGTRDVGVVSTSVTQTTTFMDISCTDTTPEEALNCANAFAEAYVEDRRETARSEYDAAAAPLTKQVDDAAVELDRLNEELAAATTDDVRSSLLAEISSVRSERDRAQLQLLGIPTPSPTPAIVALPASLPESPANKGYVSTGILAAILGLALGVGLAFLRDRLDERVPNRDDLEKALGAPVFAVIPRVPGWRNRADARLVSLAAPNSAAAEAYRAARTTLLYLANEGGLKVIAVTGPGQSEGKTTTTANLAVSLAQTGKRVVAVSADLRKPRMHRFFHIDNSIGVTSVLRGEAGLLSSLVRTEVPNLLVLASGPVPPNPAELLGSDDMNDMIDELRQLADIVLIDTPPTLVVSDILGMLPKVDGVLVVVDSSHTHRAAVVQLRHQLERAGGQVLGGLLNNVDAAAAKRGYGGYGGYGYRDDYRDPTTASGAAERTNGSANGSRIRTSPPTKAPTPRART